MFIFITLGTSALISVSQVRLLPSLLLHSAFPEALCSVRHCLSWRFILSRRFFRVYAENSISRDVLALTLRRTTTNSTLSCSSSLKKSCLSRGGHEAPQFLHELVGYCAPVPSHLPRRQSSLHIQLAHWKSSLRGPRLLSFCAKESRRGGSSLELTKAAEEGCRGECSGWSSRG